MLLQFIYLEILGIVLLYKHKTCTNRVVAELETKCVHLPENDVHRRRTIARGRRVAAELHTSLFLGDIADNSRLPLESRGCSPAWDILRLGIRSDHAVEKKHA